MAPTVDELSDLISKLGCKAEDLVRKTEPLFVNEFSSMNYTERDWIELLCQNPVLLQRPIVIDGSRALIGRPPSLILELVNAQS
ncbi:MAG: arsenate reductase (glutaredoxin) [Bacteroidia bacterium]|nr:arsenate reductase (glutaredoxin) [Bacteroidia bacterium]